MKLTFLFLFTAVFCFGQELTFVETNPLEADTFVGIDAYKSTYFIQDMVLNKQGASGHFVFNDLQLGRITSVDIINPLKIVVFYEDLNTVVLLDNTLAEIERINFSNLSEFMNIQTATLAGNNTLWVFNIDDQQLELYNFRSERKTVVSQPFEGTLRCQTSDFNYCATLTEDTLRLFNSYGSLLSETAIEGFTAMVQQGKNSIGLKENALFYLSEDSIQPLKIPLPEITIKELQATQDFLYLYDGKNLHTFSITQPKQ